MRTSFCLLLLYLTVGAAQAAQVLPTPSPNASPVPVVVKKKWSVDWFNRYQFSLHTADDPNKSSSLNSTFVVNYEATPSFRIQGALGGAQAIDPSLNFKMINPEFRGFYNLNTSSKKLRFYLGPTLALPFGTDAQDESLIFGLGVAGRVSLSFQKSGESGFRTFYDLIFNKNFHRFETSVFAQSNNQLSLNHLVYLEYAFDSQWNINATFAFSSFWNYQAYLTNSYSVSQQLDFQMTSWLTLYLSHVRGGDFLAPNGQNYSFGIFNKDSSRIVLGSVLSF